MPQLQLITPQHPQELRDVLHGLLKLSEDGDLSGMVFGCALRGQKFYFDSAGSLSRNPMMAIAVAAKLAHEMNRHLERGEIDSVL